MVTIATIATIATVAIVAIVTIIAIIAIIAILLLLLLLQGAASDDGPCSPDIPIIGLTVWGLLTFAQQPRWPSAREK